MEEKIIKGDAFYKKVESIKKVKERNWVIYYIDPITNEKWIEEYPQGELQGGGEPQLRLISKFPWEG